MRLPKSKSVAVMCLKKDFFIAQSLLLQVKIIIEEAACTNLIHAWGIIKDESDSHAMRNGLRGKPTDLPS
jgi:hypothetical protein